MAAFTPDRLRGLLLRSSLITAATLDTTTTSYTESGNEVSRPVATAEGYQTLSATGTLTSDAGFDFRITANKTGAALGGDEGGRSHWRNASDALNERRGFFDPNKPTGAAFVYEGSGTHPHVRAVRTPDHKVVAVYGQGTVYCSVLDPTTDEWTQSTVGSGDFPTIVQLPAGADGTGRLVAVYRSTENRGGSTYYTMSAAFSDDNGATWSSGGEHIPGYDSTTGYTVARSWYHNGYITLCVQTPGSTTTHHYVSDDLGASFSLVETYSYSGNETGLAGYVDSNGSVVLIAVKTSDGSLLYGRKSTPRGSFPSDPSYNAVLSSAAAAEAGDNTVGCVVDDVGHLWAYWNATTPSRHRIKVGRFDPDTLASNRDRWMLSGSPLATNHPITSGDNTNYLTAFDVVPYKAGLLLLAEHSTTATASPSDLISVSMGGYSSVDWRVQTYGLGESGNASGKLYLPFVLPSSSGWTTAGAGVEAVNADGYKIVTSGNALSQTRTGPTGASAGAPAHMKARLKMESGGALASGQMAVRLTRADGTDDYSAALHFTSTGARVYDAHNGASPGTPVGVDVTGLDNTKRYDWTLAIEANRVRVLYKLSTASLWTEAVSDTLTINPGAKATENKAEWGALATGTATATWYFLGSCIDYEQSNPAITNQTNPDDLQGAPFSASPMWIGDAQGVQIAASGGPVFTGDSYTVSSRARHGIHNLHPESSPGRNEAWRSRNTDENVIVWTPNDGATTRFLSSSIGVYAYGLNAKTATFEGQQAGGSWDVLVTLNGSSIFNSGLTFTIDGDVVRPASGTGSGSQFIEPGSLIGGWVLLTYEDPEDDQATVTTAHLIEDNTSGVWRSDVTGRPVEIRLVDPPAVAANPTTIEIIPPIVCKVAHNVTTAYKAFRLKIPASQVTADGYYTCGVFHVGEILAFGTQYARGRVLGTEAQVGRSTLRSGLPLVRKRGRARQRVEFSWPDGIDTLNLWASPAPDFIRASNDAAYKGIATRRNPYDLSGLLVRQGGSEPVVYLPSIHTDDGLADPAYISSSQALYAWPGEVTTGTATLGNEGEDEVITRNAFILTEAG